MPAKEAKSRIKINKLLEEVGWRFFDTDAGKANISLKHRTKKGKFAGDKLGNDLENAPDGFIDYLLLNEQSQPVALQSLCLLLMNLSPFPVSQYVVDLPLK